MTRFQKYMLAISATTLTFVSLWDSKACAKSSTKVPGQNVSAAEKALVQKAKDQLAKGDSNKAAAIIWENIESANILALSFLADIYKKEKKSADLKKVAELMLGKKVEDPQALTYLADSYRLQLPSKDSNVEKLAVENYRLALEKNVKFEPAYQGLLKLYDTHPNQDFYDNLAKITSDAKKNARIPKSNYFELRQVVADMITVFGPKSDTLSLMCRIDIMDESITAALSSCKEAISLNPKDAQSHVNLGIALQETGDLEKAFNQWKSAADKFPQSEMAQIYFARHLEKNKNYSEAIKYYERAVASEAQSQRAWQGLAQSQFELRKYSESLDSYRVACKISGETYASIRKVTNILRTSQATSWVPKFESLADACRGN